MIEWKMEEILREKKKPICLLRVSGLSEVKLARDNQEGGLASLHLVCRQC
jgi:hypothetical protein